MCRRASTGACSRALAGALLLAALGCAGSRAAERGRPGAPPEPEPLGPLPIAVEELGAAPQGSASARSRLFRPAEAGVYPAVVLLHGFLRSGDRFVNHARRLAERGIVTLVPDLESLLREGARERNVERVLAEAARLAARPDVDGTRTAFAGHSAGGALALEAAAAARARGIAVAGVCLLDAVPWRETVAAAAALRGVPVASFTSEPSAGNAHGSTARIHATLAPADLVRVRVVGASHVDPEDPTDALGSLFGGGAHPAQQALYGELLARWLVARLGARGAGDGTFAELLAVGARRGTLRPD